MWSVGERGGVVREEEGWGVGCHNIVVSGGKRGRRLGSEEGGRCIG